MVLEFKNTWIYGIIFKNSFMGYSTLKSYTFPKQLGKREILVSCSSPVLIFLDEADKKHCGS